MKLLDKLLPVGPSKVTTKLNIIIPNTTDKSVKSVQTKSKVLHIVGLTICYIFLAFCAFLAIFPFYYMIIGSFMQEQDLTGGSMVPVHGSFFQNIIDNYTNTLERFKYLDYVGNTLFVALTTTLLMLIVTILSAYAFARLKFRGRDLLFTVFLATMMIPGEMMIISNFTTMNNLGLIGIDQNRAQAYLAMILPFITSVYYIYLLKQNFKQIPNELYLAAKVDGKSDWEYLWKVMVPLASPTLITIAILSIIGSWNAFVWPRMVVNQSRNSQDFWLISVAVRDSQALALKDPNDTMITQYSWQMVASVLTTVPLLILFIIFRKYIMKGTSRAGIKG